MLHQAQKLAMMMVRFTDPLAFPSSFNRVRRQRLLRRSFPVPIETRATAKTTHEKNSDISGCDFHKFHFAPALCQCKPELTFRDSSFVIDYWSRKVFSCCYT